MYLSVRQLAAPDMERMEGFIRALYSRGRIEAGHFRVGISTSGAGLQLGCLRR